MKDMITNHFCIAMNLCVNKANASLKNPADLNRICTRYARRIRRRPYKNVPLENLL